jgi:hypothetical protein
MGCWRAARANATRLGNRETHARVGQDNKRTKWRNRVALERLRWVEDIQLPFREGGIPRIPIGGLTKPAYCLDFPLLRQTSAFFVKVLPVVSGEHDLDGTAKPTRLCILVARSKLNRAPFEPGDSSPCPGRVLGVMHELLDVADRCFRLSAGDHRATRPNRVGRRQCAAHARDHDHEQAECDGHEPRSG